jgi:hypothetical protein
VTGVLPFYHRGREAEGEESRMRLTKRRASQRFNPELKLPRFNTPHHARSPFVCLVSPSISKV